MAIDEERENIRRKVEALNYVRALLDRVQAHIKYLSTIPVSEQSDLQKLWVLAYEATELKMAPGTEETLFEAGINLRTLDNMRDETTNEYSPVKNERARFSLFGRRARR